MSTSTVRSKLLTALDDMQSLKAAFDYEASNSEGKFPFATLTLRGGTGEFRSTAHNLRTRSFWVRIYQEKTTAGQGASNAERIMVDVLDELEEHLDMNTTLSGTCKYVYPVSWNASTVDRGEISRLGEIRVDAVELVSSQ